MTDRGLRRAVWGLYALTIAFVLAGTAIRVIGQVQGRVSAPSSNDVAQIVLVTTFQLVYPALGAVIVSRQPRNPIGWILAAVGPLLGINDLSDSYVAVTSQGAALRPYAAWLANLVQGPAVFGIIAFLFLLFPNGHVVSPRWRKVAWLAGGAMALEALAYALVPGTLQNYSDIRNPLGIGPAHHVLNGISGLAFGVLLLAIILSAVSLVLRFRRSRGEERLQLKWVATATAIAAVSVMTGPIFWFVIPQPQWLWPAALVLAMTTIPIAIVIAMLKYRLYEIDVLINRTLVYGSLTFLLAGLYAGQIIGFQALFRAITGQRSQLAIAISTLVIAAAFNPLRRWVQDVIARTFYRRRYNAAQVLERFGASCRDATDLDQLSGDLVRVVRETMQPAHVSFWTTPQM